MTPAEFKAQYQEFDDVSDAVIQSRLDTFDLLYQGDYGDLRDYLSGLYTAHQVTVFHVNTGSGPVQTVTSRRVDSISWSYAESSTAEKAGEFASTKYGLEFFAIMSQLGAGPVMAGCEQ